jgi:apolipoprotein N-acyltransferase
VIRGTVIKAALLSVLSGSLLVFTFPSFDLHVLAWVALVPLLLAIDGKRPGPAYLYALAAGIIFFPGTWYAVYAVPGFKIVDGALISLYLAQYVAVWGLVVAWTRRRTELPLTVVAAPIWVACEYLRCQLGFLSLPWAQLGDSQYESLALLQIASLTGVYGLSFLIVFVNAALTEAILQGRRGLGIPRSSWIAALLLIAVFVHGVAVLARRPTPESTRIAVVQGNIPQERKWDAAFRQATLEKYATLTREAARHQPTLIVWPETAVPGDVQHDARLRRAVSAIASEAGTHLLVGTSEYAKFTRQELRGKHYNSVVLFGPDGQTKGEYRKMVLVPWAEYPPLRDWFDWPRALVSKTGGFVQGEDYTVFAVGPAKIGVTICWENIFPDLVREFAKRGVNLMINATNEAWFGETAASRQFLTMSAMRAAEHRIAIARATNTGISVFIDDRGKITQRLTGPDGKDMFVEGVLVGDVPLTTARTFYTRYGDVFAVSQAALAVLLLIGAGLPARARLRFVRPSPKLTTLRPAT